MPDIDVPFRPIEGVSHPAGCAQAIGLPCDCGNEMFRAISAAVEDIFTGPDAVGEEISLAPLAEYEVTLGAATILMLRQALANQKARAS